MTFYGDVRGLPTRAATTYRYYTAVPGADVVVVVVVADSNTEQHVCQTSLLSRSCCSNKKGLSSCGVRTPSGVCTHVLGPNVGTS